MQLHFVLLLLALFAPTAAKVECAKAGNCPAAFKNAQVNVVSSRFNRGYGSEMIGQTLSINSEDWGSWYAVDVLAFNTTNKMHSIRYLVDEWVEDIDLTKVHLKMFDESDYADGSFKVEAAAPGDSLFTHAYKSMSALFISA